MTSDLSISRRFAKGENGFRVNNRKGLFSLSLSLSEGPARLRISTSVLMIDFDAVETFCASRQRQQQRRAHSPGRIRFSGVPPRSTGRTPKRSEIDSRRDLFPGKIPKDVTFDPENSFLCTFNAKIVFGRFCVVGRDPKNRFLVEIPRRNLPAHVRFPSTSLITGSIIDPSSWIIHGRGGPLS